MVHEKHPRRYWRHCRWERVTRRSSQLGEQLDATLTACSTTARTSCSITTTRTSSPSELVGHALTMELFSDGISRYEGAEPFGGDIFSLRIYDRKLDAAAAAQNYAPAVAQTPALAYAVEATINEDGEAIAGSLLDIAPKLYAAPLAGVAPRDRRLERRGPRRGRWAIPRVSR